jgi:NTP pyrophosphatase (non-canonical NTP hydrolase)
MIKQDAYASMVATLAKSGADVLAGLTPDTAHQLHMAVGIAGEAGELLDAIKKAAVYCKPIDVANVIEELGDLEFYMEGLRSNLGITRQETLDANFEKLSIRYHKMTYSNSQAQERADK